jgi:hypothetical protein
MFSNFKNSELGMIALALEEEDVNWSSHHFLLSKDVTNYLLLANSKESFPNSTPHILQINCMYF